MDYLHVRDTHMVAQICSSGAPMGQVPIHEHMYYCVEHDILHHLTHSASSVFGYARD
jgi:hypothetical protein